MRTQICSLIFVCLLLTASVSTTKAQLITKQRSVLSINGSSRSFTSQNKSYRIKQSIGQLGITGTNSIRNNTLIQGFIQPLLFKKQEVTSALSELGVLIKTNPHSNSYIIIVLDDEISEINVSVYNTIGQKIISKEINKNYQFEINLNSQAIGCYILHLRANEQHYTTKIIKK